MENTGENRVPGPIYVFQIPVRIWREPGSRSDLRIPDTRSHLALAARVIHHDIGRHRIPHSHAIGLRER